MKIILFISIFFTINLISIDPEKKNASKQSFFKNFTKNKFEKNSICKTPKSSLEPESPTNISNNFTYKLKYAFKFLINNL